MGERGRILTGARVRFTLDGVTVGYGLNVTVREETTYDEIEVLDNIEVEEHAATAYRVSMNASQVRIVGQTVRSLGFMPKAGQTPEEHLLNILRQEDMVASLEDRPTSTVVARIFGVKLSTRDFTVGARGVVNEDLAFVARRMHDESEAT